MNHLEAHEVAVRIRTSWTGSFLNDEMLVHWTEFLQQYGVEDATRALDLLQRSSERVPTTAAFADAVEGERRRRSKCPACGLGFPSEERVQDHLANVHWEYA